MSVMAADTSTSRGPQTAWPTDAAAPLSVLPAVASLDGQPTGRTAMDTYVTMQGNLVADPKRTVTASGQRVTKFRIAASGRRFDPPTQEWVNTNPVYMTISCWRQLGDNVFQTLYKGDTVVVFGRMNHREWDDDKGNRHSTVEIEASSVGPDLSRYVARLSRPNREIPAGDEVTTALPEQVPATSAA
jgi:single-strand DNA-binding protein